jgi:hypothetical protein
MRYYFSLANGSDAMPDDDGIEITDPGRAYLEASIAIEELRSENPTDARDWEGWRLNVTDSAGDLVFSMSLRETRHGGINFDSAAPPPIPS